MTPRRADGQAFERRLGRLLILGHLRRCRSAHDRRGPDAPGRHLAAGRGPPFDLAQLVPDLRALEPAGFLWLGLLAVIATPLSRVVGAAIGFARRGEPLMAVIAVAILTVIAISVLAAVASG